MNSLSARPSSAYTSQMGSATKPAARGPVFPAGDATGSKKRDVTPGASLLAAALEACPENLAIIENGCLLYANPAFAETFGYSHSSGLQGAPLDRLIPANRLLVCMPHRVSKVAHFPGPASDPAFVATRRDGSHLKVQMSCAGFQAGERNLQVLRLRACLPEAGSPLSLSHSAQMESLGHLVGAVAHDFNNLLTGILLYCDLLAAGLESDNPLRAYVAEILQAGGHSAELVQQLMAVARPQAAEPGTHSWNNMISSMRNLLVRLLGENVELHLDLAGVDNGNDSDSDTCVAMDAVPMRQIILNLLLNARDAMPQGGRITLAVRHCQECRVKGGTAKPSCIVLVVTDTGTGMDAPTRSRLFQGFFTTKSAGKGAGLGLSTVGRIVKEYGGTIQVGSQPQEGTRVSIHLPRAPRLAAHHFNHKKTGIE